jgi:hypothetical protein
MAMTICISSFFLLEGMLKKRMGKMKQYLDRKGFSNFPYQRKQMTKMRIKRIERDDDFFKCFHFPFLSCMLPTPGLFLLRWERKRFS